MNYKSQLKGWAVDRIIELVKANGETIGLATVMEQADILAAYAYVPREDLESIAKDLFDLVRAAKPGESTIDALIGTLEHIKNDRQSQGLETVQ